MADHIYSGALELLVVLVPDFSATSLRVNPAGRLLSSEILETAGFGRVESVLLPCFTALESPTPGKLVSLSEAAIDEDC